VTAPDLRSTRTFPWRIEQGERTRLIIPVLDDLGGAVDVSGWPVDAKVKTEPGGPVLYTWPPDLINALGNTVSLLVPAEVSLAWTWALGWYRVKITDPATVGTGDVVTSRILQGPFVVDPD
jgi:hypothetical protein